MNALDFYAQHAREHQGSIDARHSARVEKAVRDWNSLKNELAAIIGSEDWRLNSLETADEEILMALSPKVEVENCNIDD
jgi:hypothetical protein